MSYDNLERSVDQGLPVFLYLFYWEGGAQSFYGYTNAEKEITFGGITYKPSMITHGDVQMTGNLERASLDVTCSDDVTVIDTLTDPYSSAVVNIEIRAGHQNGDGDFKIHWVGRVLGRQNFQGEATYTCESAATSLRRTGLRRNWQIRCPLVLYGPICKADRAEVTSVHEASEVDGPVIRVPVGWNEHAPELKYQGGLAEWTTLTGRREVRTIVAVVEGEGEIVLSAPATDLHAGMNVSLSPGCNHMQDDCLAIHHNIKNHGGQTWIPLQNPAGIRNIFY